MVEINLLERSHFQWVDLFVDDLSFYSGGFNAWAGVFCIGDDWIAVGGNEETTARLLSRSDRIQCFAAADDWLNIHETNDTAHRSQSWLQEQPTSRQLAALPPKYRLDFNLTRYRASALIGFCGINRQSTKFWLGFRIYKCNLGEAKWHFQLLKTDYI